jgi:hypothetical protein
MRKNLVDIMGKLVTKNISFTYHAGRSALDEPYIEFPRYKNPPRVWESDTDDFFYEMYSLIKGERVMDFYSYEEVLEVIYSYELYE